jgi:hypothetical protein
MRGTIFMTLAAVAGLALPVAGQAPRTRVTTVEMANSSHVARLPYTVEYKTARVQRLADGTTITHESTEVIAVDSQGRRMTATTNNPASADQTPLTRVTVFDPAAHTNISWTVPGLKATVMAMPPLGAARSSCTSATRGAGAVMPTRPNIKSTVEDLGMETVNGIEAHGRLTTTTTPAGAIGNNEPIVRTSEIWNAAVPGLNGLLVRSVIDDPQSDRTTKELTNLTQSEPDATVFAPPSDYEIVTMRSGYAEHGT